MASGPTSKWTDEAARKRLNEILAKRLVAQNDQQANQSSQMTEGVPKWLSYESYFEHIAGLDKAAAQLEAQGKDGKPWRTFEQHQTGLTDEEGATLKKIAYDCNQAVKTSMPKCIRSKWISIASIQASLTDINRPLNWNNCGRIASKLLNFTLMNCAGN